jgi:hypothetical protein
VTLDRPVRRAVRDALGVKVVPDEVVRAVEGDEELHLIAEAARKLVLVDDPDAETAADVRRQAVISTDTLLKQRLRQLLEEEGVSGWSE